MKTKDYAEQTPSELMGVAEHMLITQRVKHYTHMHQIEKKNKLSDVFQSEKVFPKGGRVLWFDEIY